MSPSVGDEPSWDGGRVLSFFDGLKVSPPAGAEDPPQAATLYHPAAALLAAFDPMSIRGLGGAPAPPPDADLRRLLADSTALPEAPEGARWTLRVEPRREALATFATQQELRDALALNERPDSRLQRLIDGFVLGTAPDVAALDEENLELASQVVGWLTGVPAREPLALPDLDEIRRRLDFRRLVKPLRRLAGDGFHGRVDELAEIVAHLAGPPGSPLMIWGLGGVGKSTLVARAALDRIEGSSGEGPFPVVYLDFDRKTLSPERPAALLLEAVRQVTAQLPPGDAAAQSRAVVLAGELADDLAAASEPTRSSESSSLLAGTVGLERLLSFDGVLQAVPSWAGKPLLVALDTFEVAQYQSRQTVDLLLRFLGQWQDKVPAARVIIAGRAIVEGHSGPAMELKGLDPEAAVRLLVELGVPAESARFIFERVGGSPLALRLAAEVARVDSPQALSRELSGDEFARRLDEALVEGFLFRRVLDHINDPRVRKLAHPGLVLRYITPALIRRVLAGPCQVDIPDDRAAGALWDELSRETALVVIETGARLRHRPDLRREMLGLLRETRQGQAAAIHRAAVNFFAEAYERSHDPADRAEELYHRLCLEQASEELDARWMPEAEIHLRDAVDELPPKGMAYLAARGGPLDSGGFEAIGVTDDFWRRAELRVWERKTAQWVRDLMRQERHEEALASLRERGERSDDSPLWLLEARVLKNLGQWRDAQVLLHGATARWAGDSSERIDLLLLQVWVLEHVGDAVAAREVLDVARELVGSGSTAAQQVDFAAAEARLAPEGPDRRSALERLSATLAGLSDRVLVAIQAEARRAAAELVVADVPTVARVVRLIGTGSADPGTVRGTINALSGAGGLMAGGSGRGDSDEAIRRLSETLGADRDLAGSLAQAFREGEEVADRRAASSATEYGKALTGDRLREIVEAIRDAFDHRGLDALLRSRLGVRLDAITADRSPSHTAYDVVNWAEMRGRTAELVRALIEERPDNSSVRALQERIAGPRRPDPPPGSIRLRSSQVLQFSQALVEAFPEADAFGAMLRYRLDRPDRGPLRPDSEGLARETVERANAEGWAGPLIAAAREARPDAPLLYAFAEDFGLTAARPEDDRGVREALPDLDIGSWRSRLGVLEGRICRIAVAGHRGGTGLLIAPNLVLTVSSLLAQVPRGPDMRTAVTVTFDVKRLENGAVWNAGLTVRLAEEWLAAVSSGAGEEAAGSVGLDYMVIRVEGEPGRRPVGWPRCEPSAPPRGWFVVGTGAPPPLAVKDHLAVLSCPPSGPARLSFSRQSVLSVAPPFLRYRGLAGAPGAVVLDRELRPVALHQAQALRFGGEATEPPEQAAVERFGQEGVSLSAIFTDIRARQSDSLITVEARATRSPRNNVETAPSPSPDPEELPMASPDSDVPFLRVPAFDGRAGGFESTGEDAAPPPFSKEIPREAPPSESQKARANDLFLRGALTPEELSRAKADRGGFEAIIGKSNFLPAVFLEIGAAAARSTCLIRTSGIDFLGRSGAWTGTGFLISPNVLVTNHHVLNSPAVAAAGSCVFNFQVDAGGRPTPSRSFPLRPDRLFLTSPARDGLDYAFVWVDGEPGGEFGTVRINRQAFGIAEEEFANVISHPMGRMKEVSVQQNEVQWQDDLVVHYTSDTEPGSSGASVCNNNWQLVALHHASKPSNVPQFQVLNEGIKLSAIAADLERISNSSTSSASVAAEILQLFQGTDERLGFFGTLGRPEAAGSGLEAVVNTFEGTEKDVDVAFWNVEWLTKTYETKATAVAEVIHKLNLDVWSLEESSPNAAERVVAELEATYGLAYGHAAAEPDSEDGKQSCTLLWNTETVDIRPEPWGETIDAWLRARSTDFDDLGLGGFEAVHGKIFDRYPALFKVTTRKPVGGSNFEFYVVPVHLKAMAEGSLRRKMASKILAEAVKKKIEDGASADWVIGGDFNAELDTGDFRNLVSDGMVPVSASDAAGGAISYVKGPKSLIDHVFLSPNLAQRSGDEDFFVVAAEKTLPDYIKHVSDHRPVLVRLSLDVAGGAGGFESTDGLRSPALAELAQRLGQIAPTDEGAGGGFEARRRRPRRPRGGGDGRPSGLESRDGYAADFLGGSHAVPLPGLGTTLASAAVEGNRRAGGADRYALRYTHFSVVMNGERRMPFYSAVNIDGTQLRRVPRGDNWFLDPRIPAEVQIGDEVYKNNDLDRGHMTRRLDPVWGSPGVASQADADTFCYTR